MYVVVMCVSDETHSRSDTIGGIFIAILLVDIVTAPFVLVDRNALFIRICNGFARTVLLAGDLHAQRGQSAGDRSSAMMPFTRSRFVHDSETERFKRRGLPQFTMGLIKQSHVTSPFIEVTLSPRKPVRALQRERAPLLAREPSPDCVLPIGGMDDNFVNTVPRGIRPPRRLCRSHPPD